jgi:bifunctional non-homologous end joining protein LigD
MLATAAEALPVGPSWTYEVKWDGYRVLAVKDGRGAHLISRHGKDLTGDYPSIAAAVAGLRTPAVVDGELVAIDANGRPSFQALQHRTTASPESLAFYAFDLLIVNSESWTARPLEARRRRLAALLKGSALLLSTAFEGHPETIETTIRSFGLEGVVAKRLGSRYRPGQRSDDWVKVKFSPRQEFAVGGFKPNGRSLDSLVVGYYEGRRLKFAAQVRNGLTPHTRAELRAQLEVDIVTRCPFVDLPNSRGRSHWGTGIAAEDMASFQWVKPRLVVEVSFVEWTREGVLRHPRFLGVRADKRARDVRREP